MSDFSGVFHELADLPKFSQFHLIWNKDFFDGFHSEFHISTVVESRFIGTKSVTQITKTVKIKSRRRFLPRKGRLHRPTTRTSTMPLVIGDRWCKRPDENIVVARIGLQTHADDNDNNLVVTSLCVKVLEHGKLPAPQTFKAAYCEKVFRFKFGQG